MTEHTSIITVNSIPALADHGITRFCMAVGIFDGVHEGHRHLLRRLSNMAEKMEAEPVVLTFSPHPKVVVDPKHAPILMLPPEEKAARLASCGVKAVVTLHFTPELAAMTADDFFDSILADSPAKLCGFCVGNRFHCGAKGQGTTEVLAAYGKRHGIHFESEPEYVLNDEIVSASSIRRAIAAGDLEKAQTYLSDEVTLYGTVISGFGIAGTKLEHPTANIELNYGVLPPCGVYAAFTIVDGQRHATALQIGKAPTFLNNGPVRIEAHLLDFKGNLYDHNVAVQIIDFIRPEQKFPNPEALMKQICTDVEKIRTILKGKEL